MFKTKKSKAVEKAVKVVIPKETPKVEPKAQLKEDIAYAKYQLNKFTERRKNAKNPEELKLMGDWEVHFIKKLEDLEKQ